MRDSDPRDAHLLRVSCLPLIFFVAGTLMEFSLLLGAAWSGSPEPLRLSWPVAAPGVDVAFFVVGKVPIVHSCFGFNPLEEGIFEVTLAVTVGVECAMAGVVAEACRLGVLVGFRRIAGRS